MKLVLALDDYQLDLVEWAANASVYRNNTSFPQLDYHRRRYRAMRPVLESIRQQRVAHEEEQRGDKPMATD